MRNAKLIIFLSAICVLLVMACQPAKTEDESQIKSEQTWKIHDMDRPLPPVIDLGPSRAPASPPSDAIALFSGKDLSQWQDSKGQPARWKVENGYIEVVKKTGAIKTIQKFGECQLHLEWATPLKVVGEGQERGNSGVFLMDIYEVQVLDSYNNRTYADGMAAAIYGQYPPLVNACLPPGHWQTYDIIFHRPHFDEDGKIIRPARMTVFHNGILVHDNAELMGPTAHKKRVQYKLHSDKLPLSLQDHGNPIRYRNIWIRELNPKNSNIK